MYIKILIIQSNILLWQTKNISLSEQKQSAYAKHDLSKLTGGFSNLENDSKAWPCIMSSLLLLKYYVYNNTVQAFSFKLI